MTARLSYAPTTGTPSRSPGRAVLRTPSKPLPPSLAVDLLPSITLPSTIFAHDPSFKSTLHNDQSALDYTLRALQTAKIDRRRAHESDLSDILEEGKRLETERGKLESVTAGMQETMRKEKEEVEDALSVVRNLEGRKKGMVEQIEVLRGDVLDWQLKLDTMQAAREEMKTKIAIQAARNQPELEFFESSLGINIKGKSRDVISISLTQIDATAYSKIFTFDLDLSSNYSVPFCNPPVPSARLIQLVQSLNETRDFSTFLKRMRRTFIENLPASSQSVRQQLIHAGQS